MAVRQRGSDLRGVFHHHVDRTDAVAIEPEVLVAAVGDQSLGHFGKDPAQAISVLFHPGTEALVGQIDDRQQPLGLEQRGDLVPLGVAVIDPAGVVAAAVQQDRVARFGLADGGAQRVHVHLSRLGSVDEALELEPEVGDDLRVIGPARRAHPDAGCARTLRQCQCQPHRAGAARGLHAVDPAALGRIVLPEHVRQQRVDEAHVAFRPEVGLRILCFQQLALGRLDAGEHRSGAAVGAVNAHAEIDLVGPGISVVELDQREQRVGGLLLKVGKHGQCI